MAPYQIPQPGERPLTDRENNPHLHDTQRGTAPEKPAGHSVPFTDAVFPRIALSFEQLTVNMADEQVDAIKADPDKFIAILPHGAGKKFFETEKDAATKILAFLNGLDCQGAGAIKVVTPAAKDRSSKKAGKHFLGPWTFILVNAPEAMRNFLVWQQTFPLSREIVFHALPFDNSIMSWVIMNISGSAVSNDDTVKKSVLATIKSKLWRDSHFCSLASQLLQESGVITPSGSGTEYAVYATDSWELMYVETGDREGQPDPIYILTGKPLTKDKDKHRLWLAIIRKTSYYHELEKLDIEKKWMNCVWCKSDTHPAFRCPFPTRDEGWLGPTPEQLASRLQSYKDGDRERKSEYDRNRNNGPVRNNRGTGKRGGWQVASYRRPK
jgi:hypothetical protein